MDEPRPPYQLIPYSECHRDAVLRLRRRFPYIADAWNAAHFRWEQEENPCFEGHRSYLALLGDEVVAMRVTQPALWQAGSPPSRFVAPCFCGTVIDAAHRRGGLFAELTRYAESELAKAGHVFALNFGAGAPTHLASIAEGWRAVGPLWPALWRPRFDGAGVLRRGARQLVRVLGALRRRRAGVVETTEPRIEEMARLAALADAGEHRIRRVRDEAFFRWRLRDPSSRYRYLYFERDGRAVGYAVLHQRAAPLDPGPLHLADWACDETLELAELLAGVVALAERVQLQLMVWRVSLPDTAAADLDACGFVDLPVTGPLARSRPAVLVRRLAAGAPSEPWTVAGQPIDALAGWSLRMIDSDVY